MTDHFEGDDRTMRERMLAGDFYVADDPELAGMMQRAAVLSERYRAAFAEDYDAARAHLVELLGEVGEVGEDAFIRPPLYVDYGSKAAAASSSAPVSRSATTRSSARARSSPATSPRTSSPSATPPRWSAPWSGDRLSRTGGPR